MKKFVTLLVAMAMVLAMSVTAFADGEAGSSEDNPIYMENSVFEESIAKGQVVYYAGRISVDSTLTVVGEDAVVVYNGTEYTADENGIVTVEMKADPMAFPATFVNFSILNSSDADATYSVSVLGPVGSMGNPAVLDVTTNNEGAVEEGNSQGYFYTWTAECDGTLTVGVDTTVMSDGWTYCVNVVGKAYGDTHWSDDENVVANETVTVAAGDEVQVNVNTYNPNEPYNPPAGKVAVVASYEADLGTKLNAIVINLTSELTKVDVEAGKSVYYAVSSPLNNNAVTIEAKENVTVTLNGTELVAENGVYTAVLTGTPSNQLVVTNNGEEAVSLEASIAKVPHDENNPIVVDEVADLTVVEAEADEVVYYAINGQLNNNVLSIAAAENVTVVLNGETLVAVDGVYTAVLTGTPTNQLIVTNNSEAAVSLEASIAKVPNDENNPIVVDEVADLTAVEAEAGEVVYYAINGQLNNKVLTIAAAENVVVVLNGETLVAEDGVYTVVLTGTPTNQLIVTNNGENAVSLVASIADVVNDENNPIVINNASELTKIETEAGESVYYAIIGQLSGMTLTIKGDENTVVTVKDVEVKAVDGVFTVVLDGAPTIKVVVTNNGDEAAVYEAAIGYPSPDTADHASILPIVMMVLAAGVVVLVEKKRRAF